MSMKGGLTEVQARKNELKLGMIYYSKFSRETEPMHAYRMHAYKESDLFLGIGSCNREADKSKISRLGQQAGGPGKS